MNNIPQSRLPNLRACEEGPANSAASGQTQKDPTGGLSQMYLLNRGSCAPYAALHRKKSSVGLSETDQSLAWREGHMLAQMLFDVIT